MCRLCDLEVALVRVVSRALSPAFPAPAACRLPCALSQRWLRVVMRASLLPRSRPIRSLLIPSLPAQMCSLYNLCTLETLLAFDAARKQRMIVSCYSGKTIHQVKQTKRLFFVLQAIAR